jgi:3-phytase/alkaline phosphatase D
MSATSAACRHSSKALCLLLWALAMPAPAQTLHWLGQQILPHAYDHAGMTVGGLSGLDYDTTTNRFVAISDDRSERQSARFYTLELDLAEFNFRDDPGHAGVRFVNITTLRDRSGLAHAEGTVDPESIRFAGDGGYWWASEGNARRGIAPAIEKVGAGGTAVHQLDLPKHFYPTQQSGVRDNLAFESLAIMGDRIIVGTENALWQDGPAADLDRPSPARILMFDARTGEHLAEHVYVVDAIPQVPPLPGLYRTNGLVELLGGKGMLLALERSYTMGVGNSIRLYRIELEGASDVSAQPALKDTEYTPVRKTLLLDLATLGIPLDNLEGMSWGPRLPDGRRTLVLVSDNNFSALQMTQFLVFTVED